jgi:hypothetical protein
MSVNQEVSQQVQIDQLVDYCRTLFQTLGITQLTGAPIEEVVRQCMRASCVQCGLQLGGDDLLRLCWAPNEPSAENSAASLARLAQGYCGRNGCDSFYYDVRFAEHPDLNWARLLDEANQQVTGPAPEAGTVPPPVQRRWFKDRRQRNFVIYGIAVVVIMLVVRYWITGESLPGFHKEQKFQLDPSSVAIPGKK